MDVDWAGVRFAPMYHHDGRFFRCPGLFAFVRCGTKEDRTLLFIDQADNIASAVAGDRVWVEALRLGMNEINITLKPVERIDRLILRAHIIKRCEPILNVMDEGASAAEREPLSLWSRKHQA